MVLILDSNFSLRKIGNSMLPQKKENILFLIFMNLKFFKAGGILSLFFLI